MYFGFEPTPDPPKRMKASSRASPGFGLYQPGTLTVAGRLLEVDDPLRERTETATHRRRGPVRSAPPRARRRTCSGSVTMVSMPVRATPSARSPPGGSITATAPRRDRAATVASPLGLVSMSTPTCCAGSDARVDQAAHNVVDAVRDGFVGVGAVFEEEANPFGEALACSARIPASEILVCGWI